VTAYTPEKPPLATPVEQLRKRIPGWGVDLDPADRPSVPREVYDPYATGAHWEFPERQPETYPRERSIEHGILPPVFGTTCPPKGLSGVIRRFAYARFSEARAAHWLLLILGDRVDALEEHARSWMTLRPDNPITEPGLRGELSGHGIPSRVGHRRTDLTHQPLDPVIVAGPWFAAAGIAYLGARGIARRLARAA
jgi:hypothetical protein